MKKIHATIILQVAGQGYKGNNFILLQLAEKLDGQTMVINGVTFRPQKSGKIKIDVEVVAHYNSEKACPDQCAAESIIWDAVNSVLDFEESITVLIDADKTEFNSAQ